MPIVKKIFIIIMFAEVGQTGYVMNFIKFWSGDNWQEGYNRGIKDGKMNRTRVPADYRYIRPLNFIWHFDYAAETYSEGYKSGYRDGQKVYHQVYKSTNQKGGTMAGIVADQQALENLISDIYKTRAEILNEFTKLRNDIIRIGNDKGWSDMNYINFTSAFEAVYNELVSAFDQHGPFGLFEQHLANLNVVIQKYKSAHPVITKLTWQKSSNGNWL